MTEIHPGDCKTLPARIQDLEDVLSVYEARVDGRSIPWDQVKAAVGLPLSE